MVNDTEVLNDIRKCEKLIDDGKALERLERNPDFQKLILEGFLHDLVLDLLYANNNEDNKDDYYQKLDSIKFFNNYLELIKQKANQAKNDKPEYEKELNNTN